MNDTASIWQRVKEGDQIALDFCVSAEALERFAELSGDRNPIHLSESDARARGFSGRVVYAGLLVAQVSQLLGEKIPGPGCVWQSLSLRFRKPLYCGEAARVVLTVTYVSQPVNALKLQVEIKRGEELLADGSVQAGHAEARGA